MTTLFITSVIIAAEMKINPTNEVSGYLNAFNNNPAIQANTDVINKVVIILPPFPFHLRLIQIEL
jgi:hypothetical protein